MPPPTAETSRVAAQAREAKVRVALAELGFSETAFRTLEEAWAGAEKGAAGRGDRDDPGAGRDAVRRRGARAGRAPGRGPRPARARGRRGGPSAARRTRNSTRALGDLRDELNAALRPDLSDLASGFLRDLTNGRYTELELDEDYMTTLLDEGEPKVVISGGEEDIANLALRLAISQMIAERAGQPLSLLILDEIFGSLDEDHRAAVVELLRNLADRFPQVILITHIDSVRDGFDRIVRVGFDQRRGDVRGHRRAARGA